MIKSTVKVDLIVRNIHYSEDISYIEASGVLKKIQNIKNTSISVVATDILDSITNEYNGTNLHVKAEKYYSVAQYAEAMKAISEIPESYSQYDSAENFYGFCILIDETKL